MTKVFILLCGVVAEGVIVIAFGLFIHYLLARISRLEGRGQYKTEYIKNANDKMDEMQARINELEAKNTELVYENEYLKIKEAEL